MSPSATLSVGTASWAMSFRKACPVRIAPVVLIGIGGVAFCQDVVGRAHNAVSAGHHTSWAYP